MSRRTVLVIACYATVYIAWGGTYFFIKESVATIPSFYVIGGRWLVGGLLLGALAIAGGRLRTLPTARQVLSAILLGSLLLIGGNGLITTAENRIDSYLAALVACSAPILVAVFDRFIEGSRLSFTRMLAILLGLGGVALLLYNGHSLLSSLNPWVLMAVAGIVCWSLATSLGHRFLGTADTLVSSAIQMLFVGVVCLAGSLLFSESPAAVVASVSQRSVVGMVYLAIVGSIAFAAYTYLMSNEPTERVVSYALVNPVIAVFLGLSFGGETPTPLLWVGLPLILLGLAIMLYGERLAARFRKARVESR